MCSEKIAGKVRCTLALTPALSPEERVGVATLCGSGLIVVAVAVFGFSGRKHRRTGRVQLE
jgi:hypothetical protein